MRERWAKLGNIFIYNNLMLIWLKYAVIDVAWDFHPTILPSSPT
jgi:hypothetical protein